jgi:predicted amidohydrolase YtcJ
VKALARCFLLSAIVLLSVSFLLSAISCAQSPDTIYIHGNILTGAHLKPKDPDATPARVSALALRDGRILAVGSDARVLALKTPTSRIIDLHQAFVMPGFNDAHVHLAFAGQQRLSLDLDNIASLDAMLTKCKAYAASLPPGAWIKGGGWDHTKWPTVALPTAQELDAVTGDHPAYLERTDGHIAVVNTAAMRLAGITAATQAPAGSAIDHDAHGEPTGILREAAALALVQRVIPPLDEATRRRALTVSLQDAAAHGVTSVQDFSEWADFLILEQMERENALHVRVSEWLTFNDPLDTLKEQRAHHDLHDPMLHTAMLKGFMDGSLGSRTAAMLAPYSDDPSNSGLPRYDQGRLDAMAEERAALGFQLGFHAIGDRANTMALNAFAFALSDQGRTACPPHYPGAGSEALRSTQPRALDAAPVRCYSTPLTMSDRRFRIEHAQVLAPADFDRFAALGVIASMQPSHLLTDMAWAGARLGPERSQYAYAWRSMLDHHIPLAFGTDYPVESINPFRGLYAAITRQNEAGTQTFHVEQKLTLNEAIDAYTQGSAFAQFEEKTKGRLAPGYFADFILVDRDITACDPQQLLHARVLQTVLGGRVIYTAPTAAAANSTQEYKHAEE